MTKSKNSAYCRVHQFKVLYFQRFFFFHFLGLNWSFKSNSFLPKIGVKRGGGEGGKKEKKAGGKKREGIRERRKGTPAIITPFCSPLRTVATANSDWLIRQKHKLVD